MSDAAQSPCDALAAAYQTVGREELFAAAESALRSMGDAHGLFDLLLVRGRSELGIPPTNSTPLAELPANVREPLEKASLAACLAAGEVLLSQGKLQEAWMYLRPAGGRERMATALSKITPSEENAEEIVELALYEGVDVARGFALLLDHFGVCNAITTYEGHLQNRPPAEQRECARQLLRRVHAELLENVVADIEHREGKRPTSALLGELAPNRDWLFSDGRYHLDTTHLAATVRIARVLEQPDDWRLAADLCAYGKRLSQALQYPQEEPFSDIYVAHELFFGASFAQDPSPAIHYFAERATEASPDEPLPAQTYVQLLCNVGRKREAFIQAARDREREIESVPLGSSLLSMAHEAGMLDDLLAIYRKSGDLVGFAAALLAKHND